MLENEFKRCVYLVRTVILRDGVCQNLSFQNIFSGKRRTLFAFRYFSINVKMCVLLTYPATKWV